VLSLILIHGMPSIGIPSMGIAGAGIAISCARYAGMIFSILITLYKKSPILPEN
jgi:Na+-driven multidrug efflux pump